jgi:hypothetical protein
MLIRQRAVQIDRYSLTLAAVDFMKRGLSNKFEESRICKRTG